MYTRKMRMKKQLFICVLCTVILISMSGCYSSKEWLSEHSDTETESQISTADTEDNAIKSEAATAEIPPENSDENKMLIRKKYAEILSHIYYQHRLIDGTDLMWTDDVTVNQYAIWDFDGDGREELLFSSNASTPAIMGGIMYDYDPVTEEIKEEYVTSIIGTFYDNGIIKQDVLHNHGLGSEFWPYILYEYDSSTDEYIMTGQVTTWEKNYRESDDEGNLFPNEQDVDADGVIYYIFDDETAYTRQEYEEWEQNYFNGANEIDIPWQFLDLANFQEYILE